MLGYLCDSDNTFSNQAKSCTFTSFYLYINIIFVFIKFLINQTTRWSHMGDKCAPILNLNLKSQSIKEKGGEIFHQPTTNFNFNYYATSLDA